MRAMKPKFPKFIDAAVIGAGQAGLATSYFLKQRNVAHIVLERGRVGESWRSQRWDSFVVNTPNSMNVLPGAPYQGDAPDGFWTRDKLVQSFSRYAERFELPVRDGVEVVSVGKTSGPLDAPGRFRIRVHVKESGETEILARHVVIASGRFRKPKLPAFASRLPKHILQLHTASYRNPNALPAGAVVVVGGGQSGCQIAEELRAAGRTVYLCTSKVGRAPRRYRGRDLLEWWQASGYFDVRHADLADPSIPFAVNPQVSGVGRLGHTLSYQHLARSGVNLLGRASGVEGSSLLLDNNLRENIQYADEKSARFKQDMDAFIARSGLDAPPAEDDEADRPWADLDSVSSPARLDLAEAGVSAVIWCTGFAPDHSWLRISAFDATGRPMQDRGVSPVTGLYFVGFPWLNKRKSGTICGVSEDAEYVSRRIALRLGSSVRFEQGFLARMSQTPRSELLQRI